MRWLKLLGAIVRATFNSKISLNDSSKIQFRVWITDIDASVMNHAPIMTVFEMGRIDFMIRSGFFKLARSNGWFFPSKSISVQFNKPLKAFQKASLTTKVLNVDEKWIYTEQKIVRGTSVIAMCVAKSTVKKGRETIPPNEIVSKLGFSTSPANGEIVINSMTETDELIYQRMSQIDES